MFKLLDKLLSHSNILWAVDVDRLWRKIAL